MNLNKSLVHCKNNATNDDSNGSPCLPLCEYVEAVLVNYFVKLDGDLPVDLYQMVLEQVEVPLLRNVLQYLGYNQSKAAKALGLSRGTFCKKLKQYDIQIP